MNNLPILTIAIPTFNMGLCLEKNLNTYCDERLKGRLEVLCLNNASEDDSKQIIERFVTHYPEIFTLIDRDSRGYGSSINAAIQRARGKYFRIVDADDWVDTQELVKFVDALETCVCDVVLTDYQIVNMQNGEMTPVRASDYGIEYEKITESFEAPCQTLPSIHSTTYLTQLLQKSGFYMQDGIFFVDEEYVILPYLNARTVVYYHFDIYRYQVANPAQSTSPRNRAKYQEHREKVLRRLLRAYQDMIQNKMENDALAYCRIRIMKGVGDHFTTLMIYVEDRAAGRRMADAWKEYLLQTAPEFWRGVRRKAQALRILNYLHISLAQYEALKKWLL